MARIDSTVPFLITGVGLPTCTGAGAALGGSEGTDGNWNNERNDLTVPRCMLLMIEDL